MVAPQKYLAKLEEKIKHNSRFTEFSFELIKPHSLAFQAGQYVSILVDESGERRSYSICSTPDQTNQFKTVVDLSPGGRGSQFLEQLRGGQEIEVLAPLGKFMVPADLNAAELVFVATGSGISPFKSMIEDLLRGQQETRPITLHWGVRAVEDLFWLKNWQQLTKAFSNFSFHPVVSKASEAWSLCRGRVTDCLAHHPRPENAAYFLCGNESMIEDVSKILIESGTQPELIFREQFF